MAVYRAIKFSHTIQAHTWRACAQVLSRSCVLPLLSLREKLKKNEHERSSSESIFPPLPFRLYKVRAPSKAHWSYRFWKATRSLGSRIFSSGSHVLYLERRKEVGKRGRPERHEYNQLSQPN